MQSDHELRAHLICLLRGGDAYDSFEDITAEFRNGDHDVVPRGGDRSAWQIVDHMTRALIDIIEYSDNEDGRYKELSWPDDYWATEVQGDWSAAVKGYLAARSRMEVMVDDGHPDLFKPFSWSEGHTFLREVLVAADHQSHHLGQLVELKRWLDSERPH
jgi:hypothetical protein